MKSWIRQHTIMAVALWIAVVELFCIAGLHFIGHYDESTAVYLSILHAVILIFGSALILNVSKEAAANTCGEDPSASGVKTEQKKDLTADEARQGQVAITRALTHDLNNVLTSITSNAYLIKKRIEQESPLQALIQEILSEAQRAAGLTRKILASGRAQSEGRSGAQAGLWPAAAGRQESALRGNGETILLAEDEVIVRKSASQLLRDSGYKVIEAADGQEASAQFIEHLDSIDLLVTDMIMPRISGRDLYEEVRKIKPGIRVLFMSGYTADLIDRRSLEQEGLMFISKPVQPAEFLGAVKTALERG